MSKFFVIYLLFFLLSNIYSQQRINFNVILQERGLAHSDVTSIIQDDQDFIWFGTLGGLNRFDGYELKSYANQNTPYKSVYKNRIQKIVKSSNLLWLITEGGLECFDKLSEKYLELDWKFNENNTIENTKLSSVYLTPNNTLFVLTDKYLKAFKVQINKNSNIILTEIFLKNVQNNTSFVDIKQDINGLLWVVSNKGLFLVNEENERISIRKIIVQGKDKVYQQFFSIYSEENNYLLLGTQNGFLKASISVFEKNKQSSVTATHYDINFKNKFINTSAFFVSSIERGLNKNYWIGSSLGLIKAELSGNNYNFTLLNEENSNLATSSVKGLLKDNAGCLWVSNYEGGVYYLDLGKKGFKSIVHDKYLKNSISENYIRALVEDKTGNLWIGTEKTGLNYFNLQTEKVLQFNHEVNNKNSISSNKIRSLLIDRQERLWIGTFEGINIYPNSKSKNFIRILSNSDPKKSLSNNIIFSLAEDKFGNIWAGSWVNGLNRIIYKDSKNYEIEKIYKKEGQNIGLSSNVITFIYADDFYPEVLVGTNNGLNHIFLKEDGSIKEILHYKGSGSYKKSISSNWVWPIVRQNDSIFWIGTLGGGLNKLTINSKLENGYKAQKYSINEGTPSLDIESLIYDNAKNELWLGGRGLSRFNIDNESFINYDREDGLVGNSFKVGASHLGKSGRFYFGGTDGVSYFYPSKINTSEFNPNVVLTEFYVNNNLVEINNDNSKNIYDKSLNTLEKIELNHLQNNFQIQFSSLHFANPKRNQFKYKLIGYDKDWIFASSNYRKASYSNLPYDTYIFEVKATNNDGVWSNKIKRLEIKISAPWWLTNVALSCYIVLGILILLFSYYLIIRWFRLKKAYEVSVIEEKEKEKLYQLTGQFFTNISHEFKTPLTLILNPLEKLINEGDTNKYKKEKYYQLMYKNARRLLRLINELIDYRKVNSTEFKLNIKPHSLDLFFDDIKDYFKTAIDKKEINLEYKNNLEIEKIQFDKTVLEKIIFNILGNAIKFSPEKSTIQVSLNSINDTNKSKFENENHIKNKFTAKSYIYITIQDEGKGIDNESIKHIFDRFFQGENNSEIQGSGIGLTLVKSLVDLHKMNLSVYSKVNEGTKFILALPDIDYKEVFGFNDSQSTILLSKNALSPLIPDENNEIRSKVEFYENLTKPQVLLVEDNLELRGFIKDDFDEDFHIIEASNGQEGLEKLNQYEIKVIISDIMMPIMDGVTFCRNVKQNPKFRNIPFILLSAKYNLKSQIQGVQSGADVYLPKPFNLELLHLTVLNLLKSRKFIKESNIEKTFEEARKNVQGNIENEFLKDVINCIDDNIDNVDFDVVSLCKLMGMSKTKLYTKLKDVTTESVGSLIRNIRIKKAAQILSSTDLNVIQVMDKVGIQSQSHFTKSFKKQFGVTPSEFVKNLKNPTDN